MTGSLGGPAASTADNRARRCLVDGSGSGPNSCFAVAVRGVLVLCSVAVVPRPVLVGIPPAGWLGALGCFVLWQVALAWLVSRASPLPRQAPR